MDWFQRLTGFPEADYDETKRRLVVRDGRLFSDVSAASCLIGHLELVALQELRRRAESVHVTAVRPQYSETAADVAQLHRRAEYAGALFQVASQFNLLEMTDPSVTPEDGVTRYEVDGTQGPACAIAAGPATIWRNYFAPVGEQVGQTAARQVDTLADVGAWLSEQLKQPVSALWAMRNGYALCTADGLAAISELLAAGGEAAADEIRRRLRIGVHWDVEVTNDPERPGQVVSQAFCSALPVAYSDIPAARWRAFATVILEAAYEATLLAGFLNVRRGGSDVVLLTRLGGGAFGNHPSWIDQAIDRAMSLPFPAPLAVRMVTRPRAGP